ncbi:hypothetical protein GCM10009744_49270 [Kribbella alba]|uniref:Class I SAM-dependent methyltransferase n=2 Tax=Kribbella alba TaxID=190197 RepID=A0ABP4RK20_9ACTN
MIAGEMLNWSDLHPEDGRPAIDGPAPAALLDAVLTPADSVLVAGPHSIELLAHLAGQVTSVDVLVRSAPDAEEIADQLEGHPVRVFCGSLDRFGSEHGESSYDVVVALDGLPRLVGPDTPVLTWTDALAVLKARLAPEGRLLVAAENSFGVERLIQPDVTATVPRDEAWPRDIAGSVEAPAGLKAVHAIVGGTVYAVYPSLIEPAVALADTAGPLAGAVAARAVAERYASPTLMDPYRVVQDAFAAGLGAELAPGWYFVVGAAELPSVFPADAVPAGPGVLLEESLLAALKIDDQAALRRTVPGYVSWLLEQDAKVAAVASADNLLVDGTSYKVFAGGGVVVGGTGEALVVGQLARFVRRSLEAGSREPWAVGGSARDLTALLASMAGITVTEELWASVAGGNEPIQPVGYAEQVATIARLSQELADANTQASWFESQLDGIRRSRPYRIGQAVLNPARVVVKRVRRR